MYVCMYVCMYVRIYVCVYISSRMHARGQSAIRQQGACRAGPPAAICSGLRLRAAGAGHVQAAAGSASGAVAAPGVAGAAGSGGPRTAAVRQKRIVRRPRCMGGRAARNAGETAGGNRAARAARGAHLILIVLGLAHSPMGGPLLLLLLQLLLDQHLLELLLLLPGTRGDAREPSEPGPCVRPRPNAGGAAAIAGRDAGGRSPPGWTGAGQPGGRDLGQPILALLLRVRRWRRPPGVRLGASSEQPRHQQV